MQNKLLFPLVLLAGGKSSRVGIPKGLILVKGQTWLERQCERFRSFGDSEVILVLGYGAGAYSDVCPKISGLTVVENPDPEHGPFTSIQTGLKLLFAEGREAAFILPIDVPVPDLEVWSAISSSVLPGVNSSVRVVQPTFRDQDRVRGGHPVLISRIEMAELIRMPATGRLDERLRVLFATSPECVRRIEVSDPKILMNLNTQEDWESYLNLFPKAVDGTADSS
jgi:CTP:molybdopterin cytidylyltransferase MocA